ncbi:MAG: penicillin-binding protein activator LpoB [candidate division Zixibacteria bacterium]|nr:penicillin-binding protein activator LpoB [candidate division Zixibacteria bacterium]
MKKLIALICIFALVLACGGRKVKRLDVEEQVDLSGRWNDTDSRLVSEEMVSDCLDRNWLTNFLEAEGRKPVVTVGPIRNRSTEHIDTETFTTDIERELINSGKVKFVASRDQRPELRGERLEQQDFASPESRKRLRQELGADYLMLGSVKTIVDQVEGKAVVFYQTDMELIDIETNEKVWIGSKKIKKFVEQDNLKW